MAATNPIVSTDLHTVIPFGSWEIVDVKFPTAPNTDYVIRHTLGPSAAEDVHYTVLKQSTAGTIYQSYAGDSRTWTTDYIVLRSDTASWTGRLLLTLLKKPITFNPREL